MNRLGIAKRRGGIGGSTNPAVSGFANGTAIAPSIFYTSESTLGWYRQAAGVMGLSNDSKLRLADAAGNLIRLEPGSGFFSDQQSGGSFTIDLKINGEAFVRASILSSGFEFGPGTASVDSGIKRNGPQIIEIDTGSLGSFADLKLRTILVATPGGPVATWKKYVINETALTAAGLTQDITIQVGAARLVVTGAVIKTSVAFAGTGVASLTASIGDSSSTTFYSLAYDCLAAVSDTNIQFTDMLKASTFVARDILVRFTSTGANLDQMTAGNLELWLRYEILP